MVQPTVLAPATRRRLALAAAGLLAAAAIWAPIPTRADELADEAQRLRGELARRQELVDEARRQLAELARRQQKLKLHGDPDPNDTQFVLPKLSTPPVIDGVVDDREWAGAIGVPLASMAHGLSHLLRRPSSVFYLGWDEEHLYLAQRLPLREGERLLRLNREIRHDNVAPHETSLEVYVDRKSHGSHGSGCRWQFMGNAVGNRWDREDQFEIGQNFVDWDGDWQYAQRLTPDGRYWEAEIAIPRRTVYQPEPLADGHRWWIGFASNQHRPWTWSGFYGWRIPATFREQTPEIRLRGIQRSLDLRGVAFEMAIRNPTDQPFAGRIVARLLDTRPRDPEKRVLFEKILPVELSPGERGDFSLAEAVPAELKGGRLAIIVEQDGRSLYTWAAPIDYDNPVNDQGMVYTPDTAAFPLKAAYNPLSNYLRVELDIYDFERHAEVAAARFAVRPAGGGAILGEGLVEVFAMGKGEARLPTPADLAPGDYVCAAELIDQGGQVLATQQANFVRKDHAREFPWLFDNTIGEQDVVLPPFEPLAADGAAVAAFRKRIELNGAALPARIEAAGQELLRGPIGLEGIAAGIPFVVAPTAATPEQRSASPTRARYRGAAAGGPLAVEIEVEWEYDSSCRVDMLLRPAAGATASLERLRLVIPMTAEGGLNYIANGLNMRLSNQAGRIPGAGQTGRVWDSTSVPQQRMTIGSFLPFMWLGNRAAGITWFADNDAGWWPTDAHPAIEIERDEQGRPSLVLNLAAEAVELTAPRRIVFGLNVNPVRPCSDHRGSTHTFGFLEETGRWVRGREPRNFARRYPDNPELNRKVAERSKAFGGIYAPYTEMSWADFEPEVVEYFREEWDRFGLGGPFFGKSANDYLIWLFDRWVADCGIDGLYFDNVFNKLNYNPHAGTAYTLPDGRVQPGYNLWGMRDHIKRIRAVLVARKGDAPFRICIHNTRFQFAPIMGFADLAMGGEMPTPRGDNPAAGDWMDMHSREFMEVMYNVPLWGYKLNHLYHFRPASYLDPFGEPDFAAATKVHRGAMASMLVHGVEFFQGIDGSASLTPAFKLLKQAAGKLDFIPEWEADGRFAIVGDEADLAVAAWQGENVLLLIVANHARREKLANLQVDFPALIARPDHTTERHLLDFETLGRFTPWSKRGDGQLADREFPDDRLPRLDEGADCTVNIPNTIRLRVAPRDFRAVLITNLPLGGRGSGF